MTPLKSYFLPALSMCLIMASCDERSPVELIESESYSLVELAVMAPPDTTAVSESTADSTGISQREEDAFPATLLVTHVKTDVGNQRNTFSFARVLINDRRLPAGLPGQTVGYTALDIGTVLLNGVEIPKIQRSYEYQGGGPPIPVNLGVRYVAVNVPFVPGGSFTFQATGGDSVEPFLLTINAPAELTVTPPGIVFRDQDLYLQWEGSSTAGLHVIISGYNTAEGGMDRQFLQLRVLDPGKSVRIPAKVLQLLPEGRFENFVFSFISFNRRETGFPGYPDRVLVQSASIHNVVLPVRKLQ